MLSIAHTPLGEVIKCSCSSNSHICKCIFKAYAQSVYFVCICFIQFREGLRSYLLDSEVGVYQMISVAVLLGSNWYLAIISREAV